MAHSSYVIAHSKTENRTHGILSWPIPERPRERLLEQGARALSSIELLAILIGTGTRARSVMDLAEKAVTILSDLSTGGLLGIEGLGPTKTARILAGIELGRRSLSEAPPDGIRLTAADAVVNFLRPRFLGLTEEIFLAISVDVKNRPLAIHEIARGTGEGVAFQPREIFKEVMKAGGSGIIVAHNHPSGDPLPSVEDERLTARLREGAEILGLRFLDHVIVGGEAHFSFAIGQ
jgi:DNA repair protein RadC